MEVLDQVKHGIYIEIVWQFYLYLLCMILLSILGVSYQIKRFKRKREEKKKNKKKGKRKLKVKKKGQQISTDEHDESDLEGRTKVPQIE